MKGAGPEHWAKQLKIAEVIWAGLRAPDSLSSGSSGDRHYGFGSIREIGNGIEFGASVQGWQMGETLSSIRVQGRLHDCRVTALRSFAENRDVGRVQFLDFDVLAAHCFIEGKPLVPSPHMVLDPPEEEIASVLGLYSNMIDRIWELFGGFSRAGFEELALWMMDKRQVVGLHSNTLGAAFAAFLYADIDRARQFLVELETCWERRARDEPANLAIHELRGQVLEDVSRARLIIRS